jgi:hypothetical protein
LICCKKRVFFLFNGIFGSLIRSTIWFQIFKLLSQQRKHRDTDQNWKRTTK